MDNINARCFVATFYWYIIDFRSSNVDNILLLGMIVVPDLLSRCFYIKETWNLGFEITLLRLTNLNFSLIFYSYALILCCSVHYCMVDCVVVIHNITYMLLCVLVVVMYLLMLCYSYKKIFVSNNISTVSHACLLRFQPEGPKRWPYRNFRFLLPPPPLKVMGGYVFAGIGM